MLLDLDCTTQRPNINSFLKEDFSSLSDAVTPSLSGWIDVQNPPTFSFVQVKSCHRVLMEGNVNEKYSINIPSIPFLPPQQPKPTTAATAAADTHSVSQSLHSVSTLAHNSSQRRWIACRSTGSSRPRRRRRLLRRPCCRPLAFARLSSVLSRSVRCFDVACSAVGNSLVGPRNVGLSLPSSSPFSFRSAFANVLRAARSLANITRNYYL